MADARFLLAGDSAVAVEFGNEVSPAINAQVRAFHIALAESGIPGLVETVPTYRSLMVHYDPGVIRYEALVNELRGLLGKLSSIPIPPSGVLEIPVLYGGEGGTYLDFVAEYAHKTPEEVIRIHTSTEYLIYMLGFTPGFAYLGGMSGEIAAPRLKQPRVKIPAGPVVRQGCYGAALCAVFPGAAGAHPAPGGHTGPECSACGFHGSFIYFLPEGNQ